ncbi:hypothetical protein LX16_2666 [Stackebrandtia albiflava]|uniref:Uncharacterized protein n=1 Tax=Stackebrandtia albiflava TaxID=406432 RepID=A0A562V259_9ACTN|nr:hypothetical protein [Stackebrandtia albiflava]TWJ11925.1 hypothetical protein LX16_2666 [Stackebrandtia albiflava]
MLKRAAVTGLAGLALITGCTGGPEDPEPSQSASPEPPLQAALDAAELLTVAESGFTVDSGDDGETTVSYAIVLENQSPDHASFQVGVDVGWVDDAGEPLPVLPPAGDPVREHDVKWIPPGETWVLADVVEVDGEPTDFTLEFADDPSVNRWFAFTRLVGYGELAVTDATVRDGADDRTATLTVESTFPETLNAVNFAMVFRDDSGAIVGGNKTYGEASPQVAPGTTEHDVYTPASGIPESADMSAVEYHAQLTWRTVWAPTEVN